MNSNKYEDILDEKTDTDPIVVMGKEQMFDSIRNFAMDDDLPTSDVTELVLSNENIDTNELMNEVRREFWDMNQKVNNFKMQRRTAEAEVHRSEELETLTDECHIGLDVSHFMKGVDNDFSHLHEKINQYQKNQLMGDEDSNTTDQI
jgi:hypothetical protein